MLVVMNRFVVDVPIDKDIDVVVADALSESKMIAKASSNVKHAIKVAVVVLFRLSQATSDIEVVCQGKSGVMEEPCVASVADELVYPFLDKDTGDIARVLAKLGSSPGVNNADLVAARTRIQELQANNVDLLARSGVNQTIQMDSQLKLCSVKKTSSASGIEFEAFDTGTAGCLHSAGKRCY